MYYLEVETPEGTRHIQLTRDRMSIGRLSYNDIVLPSAQISRQHAELRLVNGEWWIADLRSTNGLHMNTQRVREHRLTPGDLVVLAPGISLRFLSDAAGRPSMGPSMGPGRVSAGGPRSSQPPDFAPIFPSDLPATVSAQPPSPPSPQAPRPDMRPTQGPRFSSSGPSAGNMPMPPGPISAGGDLSDPYRRNIPANEAHRVTARPALSLLHVCQTCGQLTAPDSIFCQSCHHSIAYECPNCRLSILPIQERCPRCQSPNPGSVRRQHRATGA
jgi:hypothetical protein